MSKNDSVSLFVKTIDFILAFIGILFILSPLTIAGGVGFTVLGTGILMLSVFLLVIKYRDIKLTKSPKAKETIFFIIALTALALEAVPGSIIMLFSDGPDNKIANSFSYFSLTPIGYANFFPAICFLFSCAMVILSLIILIKKHKSQRLDNAVFIISFFSFFLSVLILLPIFFGIQKTSVYNYIISALLLFVYIMRFFTRKTHMAKASKKQAE